MIPRFTIWNGSEWLDITDDVRVTEDQVITGGRPDEGTNADPGSLSLKLNNGVSAITGAVGRYSPRNPESDLYGVIGRNTPLRMEVRGTEPSLLIGGIGSRARVTSASALNVSGDLDVQIDVSLDALPAQWDDDPFSGFDPWEPAATELVGRYGVSGSHMWRLMISSTGAPYLVWSVDGTNDVTVAATEALPYVSGQRFALRATLDANNGASGHTVTFYTAPTISGPWVQLGQPVVTAGTTSINTSGTADLHVGDISGAISSLQPSGHIFAARVLSGIGGTAVADVDFTAQTVGADAFTDAAGRDWLLIADAAITDYYRRFHGEVSSWPSRWDVSGVDVYVPLTAAGILRRLGQGQKALQSTLRRRIPAYDPLAYWPMEEDAGTRQNRRAGTPIDGAQYMATSGLDWAADTTLPGSSPLPKLADGAYLNGRIPKPDGSFTSWAVEFVYFMPTAPASTRSLFWVSATGTVRLWQVLYGPPAGGDLTCRIIGTDGDGTEIVNVLVSLGDDVLNTWVRQRLTLTQSGGSVDWQLRWLKIGSSAGVVSNSYSGSIGRPTAFKSPESYHADMAGISIGHVSAWAPADNASTAYNFADHGFSDESASDRLRRLAEEEGLPLSVVGSSDDTAAMGPQRPATLLELLQECADTDGGILTERRETLGLQYRPRATRYNQVPRLALDYAQGHIAPPLDPQDDDLATRNDVTVTSPGGSSARAVLREGALSVRQPPNGVGVYDTSVSRNLERDGDLEPHANWLLHLGTFDGIRYPALTLDMANSAMEGFRDELLSVQPGDRITIANPPEWMPPDTIDLFVDGYRETINEFDWLVEFNCSPAGPWVVGEVAQADPADDGAPVRADTDGSRLVVDIDSDDTELAVHSYEGPAWVTSSGPAPTDDGDDLPFDITVGGEAMTVSDIQPYLWDTFTRSVTDGWGSTPSAVSLSWLLAGGATAERDVSGTQGTVNLPDTTSPRFQYLNVVLADSEVLTAVTVPALATGGSLRAGILLRISGANYYQFRANFTTTGAVGLDIVNSGSVIEAVSSLGRPYTAGSKWWLRCRIDDQTIVGKAWLDGTSEPGWQITETVTGSTIATGLPGVSAARASGNTNASPTLAFDDFTLVTPQRFAVQRSVNGIEKSHNAGDDVRLADPSIVAL
jgi:hypothetical protein